MAFLRAIVNWHKLLKELTSNLRFEDQLFFWKALVQGPTFVMGRHFESTQRPFHFMMSSTPCFAIFFFTRPSSLLVSLSKMLANNSYQNTPALQANCKKIKCRGNLQDLLFIYYLFIYLFIYLCIRLTYLL